MRAGRRNIKSGKHYNSLFPTVEGGVVIIKKQAFLTDTVELMKKVIEDTLSDTSILAPLLDADTVKQTCRNIWNFTFNHLQYTRDQKGKEQVRRPARSWLDRARGVDCDCMTVFICSILRNLGIPYTIRLTKDKSPEFEHVYPVVKTNNEVIILDAVVHEFNREAPHREKKDIEMELQYLNGIEDQSFEDDLTYDEDIVDEFMENDYPEDAQQLVVDDELDGLEGRKERLARRAKRRAKRAERKKIPLKQRIKQGFSKVMNVANKLNPAAALMRLGILASMKLNIGKVARRIRFAYWDPTTAKRNNMDMKKYYDLVKVKDKLETIFFGAGGKKINLKKAILKGKGNKDKRVILNGLGSVIDNVQDEDDLRTILGEEMFQEEVGDQQIEGLGVVTAAATGAAITAAAGVVASIVALLKKVGGGFKKGTPQAQQQAAQERADDGEEKTRKFSLTKIMNSPIVQRLTNKVRGGGQSRNPSANVTSSTATSFDTVTPTPYNDEFSRNPVRQTDAPTDTPTDADPDAKDQKGFGAWVKKNKVPVILGSVVIVGGIAYLVYRGSTKNKAKKSLDGVDGLDGRKRRTTKRKSSTRKSKSKAKRKTTRKTGTRRKMIELG